MSLKRGDVFWDKNDSFPNKPAHPHIVIAISEKKEVVYVVTSTKKRTTRHFALKKEGKPPEHAVTFVVATPSDCPCLPEESFIDCHNSWFKSEYTLTRRKFYVSPEGEGASNELLAKIIVGVLSSRSTDPRIIEILRSQL